MKKLPKILTTTVISGAILSSSLIPAVYAAESVIINDPILAECISQSLSVEKTNTFNKDELQNMDALFCTFENGLPQNGESLHYPEMSVSEITSDLFSNLYAVDTTGVGIKDFEPLSHISTIEFISHKNDVMINNQLFDYPRDNWLLPLGNNFNSLWNLPNLHTVFVDGTTLSDKDIIGNPQSENIQEININHSKLTGFSNFENIIMKNKTIHMRLENSEVRDGLQYNEDINRIYDQVYPETDGFFVGESGLVNISDLSNNYYSWGKITEGETFVISSPTHPRSSTSSTPGANFVLLDEVRSTTTFELPENAKWLDNSNWSAENRGFSNLQPGEYFFAIGNGEIVRNANPNQAMKYNSSGVHHFSVSEKITEIPLGDVEYNLTEIDGKAVVSNLHAEPGEGNGDVKEYTVSYTINGGKAIVVTVKPGENFIIPGTQPGDKITTSVFYTTITNKISNTLDKVLTLKKDETKPKPDPEENNNGNNTGGNNSNNNSNEKPGKTTDNKPTQQLAKTGTNNNVPLILLSSGAVIIGGSIILLNRKRFI